MSNYSWMAKYGNFEVRENVLIFKGESQKQHDNDVASIGLIVCNRGLVAGTIEATVEFKSKEINNNSCCLVPFYDNENNYFTSIGFAIGNIPGPAFTLSIYSEADIQNRWQSLKIDGSAANFKPNIPYKLKAIIRGSKIELIVNDVGLFTYNLNMFYPKKQSGLFLVSKEEIIIRNFKIIEERPKAFTVMQFSSPFNELFDDVIVPVCKEKDVVIKRVDKMFGTGLILNDIINEIETANFIIAEITPKNTNVFFEIGYALALNKPIVLIAEKEQEEEIPFDVRGFRILFYENTIAGKNIIIENLKNHIDAILQTNL